MLPMHDADDTERTVTEEDADLDAALLDQLVGSHPVQLTEAELVLEMHRDPEVWSERDTLINAMQRLVNRGLARKHGPFVLPTRAALAAGELYDRL
jgi:hypothetical protein